MKEKKVTCMFIPDGQVSLNAKIDRSGFCEGEDICINAKFENTCSRIVVPKAAIIAKHTYQANGRAKVFRQKLSSVRGNHIISGMCDAWQGKTIRVPKIKPSMLGCDIIRVEYALMVRRDTCTIASRGWGRCCKGASKTRGAGASTTCSADTIKISVDRLWTLQCDVSSRG